MDGLPLLSFPPPDPPDIEESNCRKCSKEFNIIFTRPRRCQHCGYSYCSSCADYQALMPRSSSDNRGYDPQTVCAFCIEMLNITANSRSKLRNIPLSKLRAYMKAYNISGGETAVEKDDLVNAILEAKGPEGCLYRHHEEYYRLNSVPRGGSRPRGLFSRSNRSQEPSTPPQSQQRQYAPSPGPPPQRPNVPSPRQQANPPPFVSSAPPFPPPPPSNQVPPLPTPPPRPRSAAPTVTPQPSMPPHPPLPVPNLDSLLQKSTEEIARLPISTLKSVLFDNRVRASGVLEKTDLVQKVLSLVADERLDRAAKEREEREEAERMEWARQERLRAEEKRIAEEKERREGRQSGGNDNASTPIPHQVPGPSPPHLSSDHLHDGLCVVCQDEHANMAIIDCGHLALCKGCSEIIMNSTRECPLCRTRIITEQRLLRIFKT
ncbi:hypothetical protein BU17DRAFT_42956 [Hysterangium stoloniferum]|nr:hypothetical protein BU17DRAFT_42956 [Hysterangium stoloniferum]